MQNRDIEHYRRLQIHLHRFAFARAWRTYERVSLLLSGKGVCTKFLRFPAFMRHDLSIPTVGDNGLKTPMRNDDDRS